MFDLMAFYGQTAPLTLLSIALFVLAGWLFTDRLNLYYGSISAVISLFFIGLSAITLPPAAIRDSLYRDNSNSAYLQGGMRSQRQRW